MVKIIHLNTLLDIMIMLLLDHYLWNFLKRLAILIYLKIKKTKITTKTMSLMVKDKQRFKNCNKIWEKPESLMRKKFDSKLFHGNDDNKYIKTKIKTFKDSIITNFHNKKSTWRKNTIQMFINNSVRFYY